MTTPGVPPVPYVEYHLGERRVLLLRLLSSGMLGSFPPVVSIDGRQYISVWGDVPFEIPADRPVHVSVHVEYERMASAASVLLPPQAPPFLTFQSSWGGTASLR